MALRAGVVGAAEPGRTLPLAAGGLLLALVVAGSTVRAGWVSGAAALPSLAVLGALTGAALGLSRARGSVALALATAPAPIVALIAVRSEERIDLHAVGRQAQDVLAGQPPSDPAILLFLLYALFWLLGAWLAWGVLHRRQPLLAVAPAGVALATNVLNFPDGQDAYVFWFVVLTLALLLWSTYHASLAAARLHRVELAENARWDFWERGAVAAAALVAFGVLVPPLSVSDRTLDIQNGLSDAWGRITHSSGPGAMTSVGFSANAGLGGALTRDNGVVFEYTTVGDAAGPSYFRGLSLQPQRGQWAFMPRPAITLTVGQGNGVSYGETYVAHQQAAYAIDMLRPPAAAPDLIFVPGELESADRQIVVMQSQSAFGVSKPVLQTVDQVTAASGRGAYRVQVEQSVASEAELRGDVVAYPPWIGAYRGLPDGYRAPQTLRLVRDLAMQVTAGASNPYDRAVAIEQYLRTNFTYTLTPGAPPGGIDAEENFLFRSRAGYCQYFATAMADMLRSIGIPVRLVNGYGPGTYDDQRKRFVVRESDAHTWPEVYFPSYGWIPFEPTPDGLYTPIARGTGSGVTCSGIGCQSDSGVPLATPAPAPPARPRQEPAAPAPAAGGSRGLTLPSLRTWTPIGALVLALLVLLYVLGSRFLRPQTVAGVWRRAMLLLQLAGVRPRIGETPIEFGDRVAGAFPEAATGMRQLAGDYATAVYAPPRLAESRRAAIMAGWGSLRPLLLRRVAARLRRR
jgi:transglutaminase-like putative cysteine protease